MLGSPVLVPAPWPGGTGGGRSSDRFGSARWRPARSIARIGSIPRSGRSPLVVRRGWKATPWLNPRAAQRLLWQRCRAGQAAERWDAGPPAAMASRAWTY